MSSTLKVKLHFSSGEKQPVSQFAFVYVLLVLLGKRNCLVQEKDQNNTACFQHDACKTRS